MMMYSVIPWPDSLRIIAFIRFIMGSSSGSSAPLHAAPSMFAIMPARRSARHRSSGGRPSVDRLTTGSEIDLH